MNWVAILAQGTNANFVSLLQGAFFNIEPQEDNPVSRSSEAIDEFPEIFVLCKQDSVLGIGTRQDYIIRFSVHRLDSVQHVVTTIAKYLYDTGVATFVGQKPHSRCPLAKTISS